MNDLNICLLFDENLNAKLKHFFPSLNYGKTDMTTLKKNTYKQNNIYTLQLRDNTDCLKKAHSLKETKATIKLPMLP